MWTPQTKRFVNPKTQAKASPQEQFEYSLKFYEAKDYPAALREFKKLVRTYPQSTLAPEAQYYIGLSLEELESYYEAFLAYQKVIDIHPSSDKVDAVIEREYKIAELFSAGQKQKILGLELLPARNKAIEIYKKVVENNPYGHYGPLAQFKLGILYKEFGNYQEAVSAMEQVVKNYPDNKLAIDARLQIAQMSDAYSLKPGYDQSITSKAVSDFEELIKTDLKPEQKKEVESSLKLLREKEAESNFKTAEFYERRRELKSAIIYYEEIIKNFPDTTWANKAAERIEILKKQKTDNY